MRIAFFTYWGGLGDRILEWLAQSTSNDIVAVVSRPGEPGESIHDVAFRHYLPLYKPPVNVNDPRFVEVLRRLEPDLSISMYFGRLFASELLAVPRMGCINMHPSLLPKYRGQGPSTWPIINGEAETGQTIHWLNEGIDTGDIIAQRAIPIDPQDTGATLSAKLTEVGYELFVETWPLIESGKAPRIPQDDAQAIYSVAPRREHARIAWGDPAERICNVVRAFTRPGKGAWARVAGKRLYVWRARVLDEALPADGKAPGEVVAVTGTGVVVQTGRGQVILSDTEVGREGPSLVGYLGGLAAQVPVRLG